MFYKIRLGIYIFISLFLFNSESYCQDKIGENSEQNLFILDAHTHHGFPSLLEEEIDEEMAYLKRLGYEAINFVLPVDRSQTDDLLARIKMEMGIIKKLADKSK